MATINVVKTLEQKLALNRSVVRGSLLVLVLFLGVGLRVYDLGAESYWRDEVTMIRVAGGSMDSILLDMRENGRPPIYVLLAHGWIQAFGTSEVATRALSVFFGSASLLLIYLVGYELFGRQVGLLSTLLMAISEFQIYFSQNFRYYSLYVFLALLTFFFFIRAFRTGRHTYFLAYALSVILLFYTHAFGVFILAAQNIFFVLHWRRFRSSRAVWVLSQFLILLAIGSQLLFFTAAQTTAAQASGGTTGAMLWIPNAAAWSPFVAPLHYIFPSRSTVPDRDYSWAMLAVAGAFMMLGILLFVLSSGMKQWLRSVRSVVAEVRDVFASRASELLLVSCWLLFPIIIPFILSKFFGPMYVLRYTIAASPALYILLALAIIKARKVVPQLISLGALAILIVPGLHEYYATPVKEQWREAAAYIEQHAGTSDVRVFAGHSSGEIGDSFDWYYHGNLPRCDLDQWLRDDTIIASELTRCTSGKDRVWVIMLPGQKNTEPFEVFFSQRQHTGMRLVQETHLRSISIRLFALTE